MILLEDFLIKAKESFNIKRYPWVNFIEGIIKNKFYYSNSLGISELTEDYYDNDDYLYINKESNIYVKGSGGVFINNGIVTRYGCFLILEDGNIIKDGFYIIFSSNYETILYKLLTNEMSRYSLYLSIKYLDNIRKFTKRGVVLLKNNNIFNVPYQLDEPINTEFYGSAFFYLVLSYYL